MEKHAISEVSLDVSMLLSCVKDKKAEKIAIFFAATSFNIKIDFFF